METPTDGSNQEITGIHVNTTNITGVSNNNKIESNKEQYGQYEATNDNKISKEDQSGEDTYVNINNINTVKEGSATEC